jgi:(p)ppGpp synthase/HD superfamily hydrolase
METKLTGRFEEALQYAFRLHANQARKKTGRPYVGHLLGVAALVLQYDGDEEQAVAALLHDAVEDCGGWPRLEEIRRKYGERAAHIVEGCTNSFEEPKPPWRSRKEKYLAHVPHADADTRLVSAADKLHNVREILMDYRAHSEAVWERFSGGREGSLWYYRALVSAFCDAWSHPIVEELDRAVSELEGVAAHKS